MHKNDFETCPFDDPPHGPKAANCLNGVVVVVWTFDA